MIVKGPCKLAAARQPLAGLVFPKLQRTETNHPTSLTNDTQHISLTFVCDGFGVGYLRRDDAWSGSQHHGSVTPSLCRSVPRLMLYRPCWLESSAGSGSVACARESVHV